jgi:predicted ATPase
MKIDIHVHTKKIKSGDAETRNIDAVQFNEIIRSTDVRILAITNHNHFDLQQFENISSLVEDVCQIWPGIELDIFENNKRAHLLVIANPKNSKIFNDRCEKILADIKPDNFTITLKDTVDAFDDIDCIYIAHYFIKKPNLGDVEIELLTTLVSNPKRILKEATNSISAGIYISHGHNSIYGSDVQDWSKYINTAYNLPELRLPVDSFEQFCLLLEKDEATINTILNKKDRELIIVSPFNAAEPIELEIFNDINILFGSKGTGKTEILESLSKYFNHKGHKTNVYKSNDFHLDDIFDLKGHNFNIDVSDLGLEECAREIEFIKNVTEDEVISLIKYKQHFSIVETNKISQKLKIKNIVKLDEENPKRRVSDIEKILGKVKNFNSYVKDNEKLSEYIDSKLINELAGILEKILDQLMTQMNSKFLDSKSIKLLNQIVEIFNTEIAKKTGIPPKPTSTGFADYARNRIKIEIATLKISGYLNKKLQPIEEYAGNLGVKGDLFCKTSLVIQNGNFTDGSYSTVKNINKTPQKEFGKALHSIMKHIYSIDLFEKITELNQIENIELIKSISDLLLFKRYFSLNEILYHPSNGESSMILLHKELKEDKAIYLIDEPEKSLGNDYINDVIVPLLKEKAILGKKVIIATHDANIAVRTLPYNSIYRLHENGRYYTMTGNPFYNTLKCIYGTREDLDWKEISMKTLEGGKAAFGERGKIYGN